MARVISFTLLFVFACGGLLLANALAGDEKPAGPPAQDGAKKAEAPLTLASDEEVAAALAEFKQNFKAKGVAREEKIMHRDWAMQQIAPLQHPDVVKALGKVTKSGDPDLRMLAMIYLGDQKALPHQAAKPILAAMKKDKKSVVLLMTGLQSLASLKYLGARDEIARMLKHQDYAVKKAAIIAVGGIKDIRMLKEILRLIGLKVDTEGNKSNDEKKSGGKETTEEGYSWDGAEAVVDRGEADNTQENADAKAQAESQIAANKAAAAAASGGIGNTGGGISSGGGGGGRGGQSRSPDELIPSILRTLKALTGEEFESPGTIKKWLRVNDKAVANTKKLLDQKEKDQKSAK